MYLYVFIMTCSIIMRKNHITQRAPKPMQFLGVLPVFEARLIINLALKSLDFKRFSNLFAHFHSFPLDVDVDKEEARIERMDAFGLLGI